jgi:magnesium-transporting ATPase (P-type)
MNQLNDYGDTCLECLQYDYTLVTIIFNAFIFCQFFNEYNARFIGDELNMFSGICESRIFLLVSLITFGCQIMLVEVGGEFLKTRPLTIYQWLITVALGAIALPVGVLMRLIPIKEDPNTFFHSAVVDAAGSFELFFFDCYSLFFVSSFGFLSFCCCLILAFLFDE